MIFSIVVPTCNRNEMLNRCLVQLQPAIQGFDENQYEIIITDDGDAARSLVHDFRRTRWTSGPKRGPAANRNNGAGAALGQWIIFIDDDCVPDPDLLNAYAAAILSHPGAKVFEGRIYAERAKERMDEDAPINETGGYLWSCNFMIEKALFGSLGGFNEEFPHAAMEDVELADRVRRVSEVVFVPTASVMHPWRRVSDPAVKYNKAFDSHKIYFRLNPAALQNLRLGKLCFQLASSIVRNTVRDAIRYRGKGLWFPIRYHVFQIRLIWYVAGIRLRAR
jgi:GT2 family glycosyltransferase